jgi:hypothetical protein
LSVYDSCSENSLHDHAVDDGERDEDEQNLLGAHGNNSDDTEDLDELRRLSVQR